MRGLYPSRTSEFDFVVATSGAACTDARGDAVSDWSKVVDLAIEHRVLPRVFRNSASLIPQFCKQNMYDHVVLNTRNALRNLHRTIEAVQLLERANIPVIVLKGPILAHQLYGDYGMRICNDVDLLVRSNDVLRAAQVFSLEGYQHHTELTDYGLQQHRKLEHDVAFAHPSDGTLIELHGAIAQPHYSYQVKLEEWWAARQPIQVADAEVYVLDSEHAYLLAVLHAAKHQWSRLDLISDLAAFQHRGIRLGRVYLEAASAGLTRVVEIAEALTGYFFRDLPLPEDRFSGRVASQLIIGKSFGRWQGAWVDVQSRERVQDRIRYLAGRFVHKPLLGFGRKVK